MLAALMLARGNEQSHIYTNEDELADVCKAGLVQKKENRKVQIALANCLQTIRNQEKVFQLLVQDNEAGIQQVGFAQIYGILLNYTTAVPSQAHKDFADGLVKTVCISAVDVAVNKPTASKDENVAYLLTCLRFLFQKDMEIAMLVRKLIRSFSFTVTTNQE